MGKFTLLTQTPFRQMDDIRGAVAAKGVATDG